MRQSILLTTLAWTLFVLPAVADEPYYHIQRETVERDGRSEDRLVVTRQPDEHGKPTLFVTQQFKILHGDQLVDDVPAKDIEVTENGQVVKNCQIHLPTRQEKLTTVLAIDISGSMAEHGKIDAAKRAALSFLENLDPQTECGLILFDHRLVTQAPPTTDRAEIRRLIDKARPGGGTAYFDATARAVEMLQDSKGRRAVVLMTDGVDLNSKRQPALVMELARKAGVTIYTVGVGEPGQNTPVTSVLVLDHSGSMEEQADTHDHTRKIEALKRAAARFVDIMRPGARTTLLPFNNIVDSPKPFTSNKETLKSAIRRLHAEGGTSLYDAAYDAVQTLVASQLPGKTAVVVLTDGVDEEPGSNHTVDEVIEAAKQARIPLHMLGFGRDGDLDEKVMRRMALATGGTYHRARNEQTLFDIFENLSIQLHDEGIDEASLRALAEGTGGRYFPAHDVSQLRSIYEQLAGDLRTSYLVTFPSLNQDEDGTSRVIGIAVVRDGVRFSDVLRDDYNVHGVIVPDMDPPVYLGLLLMLSGLLVLPTGLKWFARRAA
jgi:VWFA-related protein